MSASRPSDDQRCIWMDAGVITYKLCDHEFNCDYCPLDMVLRKSSTPAPDTTFLPSSVSVEIPLPDDLSEDAVRLLRPYTVTRISDDVRYSGAHLWVRGFSSKLTLIGIDSFLVSLFPAAASIVLNAQDTHVERGRPFGWVYACGKSLPLLTPLSGTILRHNNLIGEDLTLLRENNHDLGWLISLLPSEYDRELPLLQDAAAMRDTTLAHMDSFTRLAIARLRNMAGPDGLCLNDGGIPVQSLEEALGGETYHHLVRGFFLMPG